MVELGLNIYWKTIVSTIRDGIMILDPGGTIVSVNAAMEKITGYSRDEMVGSTCDILKCDICPAERDTKNEHWCRLFKNGYINTRKCIFVRKDGSFIHVLKNAALIRDYTDRVIGAVETVADITDVIEKDNQIEAYRKQLRSEDGFYGLIGMSLEMQKVYEIVRNAAQSEAPVIIFGESGSGKELVSRAIHKLSERGTRPFVKINCAALTESLLESELFGHMKGAFTGAHKTRIGRFEAAHTGDIFLDEIGDLPLSTQVKLLRVLEEKTFERVGGNTPIEVDVRIISATNRNLMKLIEEGAFREDFFYRINVIPIHLPPLRNRKEDIPFLAEAFFKNIQLKSGKNVQSFSREMLKSLMEYNWPGNVRELKSAFEYAFVSCRESVLEPEHLPPMILNSLKKPAASKSVNEGADAKKNRPVVYTDSESRILIDALNRSNGNQSEAARILGVSRVTVWKRMRKYGIKLNQ